MVNLPGAQGILNRTNKLYDSGPSVAITKAHPLDAALWSRNALGILLIPIRYNAMVHDGHVII